MEALFAFSHFVVSGYLYLSCLLPLLLLGLNYLLAAVYLSYLFAAGALYLNYLLAAVYLSCLSAAEHLCLSYLFFYQKAKSYLKMFLLH